MNPFNPSLPTPFSSNKNSDYSPPIRIELPSIFGMKTVNSYLYLEPEPTLIDCGENTQKNWDALEEVLSTHNLQIKDIRRVIITHPHVDHMGMAGKICEHSDATIWVSDYVYDWSVDLDKMRELRIKILIKTIQERGGQHLVEMFTNVFGKFRDVWLPIPSNRIQTFPMEGELQFGEQTWQIVYAPGHCISQTCFYQPETKQLFSADMLLRITPTPVIDVSLTPPYERNKSIFQLLDSYQKFAAMDIDVVYPGHYEIFYNAHEVIERQLKRIEQRKLECLEGIKNGVSDFWGLLKKLYGSGLTMPAVPMLIGYLDLLEEENRISVLKTTEGLRYFPA